MNKILEIVRLGLYLTLHYFGYKYFLKEKSPETEGMNMMKKQKQMVFDWIDLILWLLLSLHLNY